MQYAPLEDILAAVAARDDEPGSYTVEYPRSISVGIVIIGGLLISTAHRVGNLYIADVAPASARQHVHLQQHSVYFFRPVFAAPKQTKIVVKPTNCSKVWTTLNIEISQDGKQCMVGYFVFTNLKFPGQMSADTRWKLTPPAPTIAPALLGSDDVPDWVSYTTPLAPNSIRNGQAYVTHYLPIKSRSENYCEHWIRPAWQNAATGAPATWTNELIHFAMDNHLIYWGRYVGRDVLPYGHYDAVVAAGLEQRQARREGRDDRIFGKDLEPDGSIPWLNSSVAISTEVKKVLPPEGVEWLFLRFFTVQLKDNRMDEQIYLLDVDGEVVAIMHHQVHVVPALSKSKDKKAKI